MALWLEVDDERIPVIRNQPVELNTEVANVTVTEELPVSREDLAEREYKDKHDIEYVIRKLRKGDIVYVETRPKSYSGFDLEIEKGLGDEAEASGTNKKYRLVKRYWHNDESASWLRTKDGNESRGPVEKLEVLSLTENPGAV